MTVHPAKRRQRSLVSAEQEHPNPGQAEDPAASLASLDARNREAVARRAAELGVSAELTQIGAPFVLTGVVDGRGFYLRERHEQYEVVVADDAQIGAQPWSLAPERVLQIASGTSDDLFDASAWNPAQALAVAVDAVRVFAQRRVCPHPSREGDRYCPQCGVRLDESEQWRA